MEGVGYEKKTLCIFLKDNDLDNELEFFYEPQFMMISMKMQIQVKPWC